MNVPVNGNPPAPAQSIRVRDIVHGADAEPRDSAYFSSDASSKHTSAASFGANLHSPTGSGSLSSPMDKTPSPTTSNHTAPPHASLAGTATDPRQYDRASQPELGINGTTLAFADQDPSSRRTSVDSRINQNFSDMRLATSAYSLHNQSGSSLQNTLATQRHPRPGFENLSMHRISNGYQPSADRTPETGPRSSRTAPAITGPATGTIARAAEPTKGQAWAFPDSDTPRTAANGPAFQDSRRSSIAESFTSSQFTTESRLPPGQRRLDEAGDYANGVLNAPHDYPPMHHHTLQRSQDDDDGLEPTTPAGSQPYSRTPESRQSHKLAERKRRTEMKELFESLRDLMPQDRGAKASKWEILQKAIVEHQRHMETIRSLQSHYNGSRQEADLLRQEVHALKAENHQLRLQVSRSGGGSYGPAPVSTPPSGPYPADPYANARTEQLPPLRSIGSTLPPAPESMMGVQYDNSRPPSFRSDRP
ncbi:related to Protein esc1 [Cephalotrichum gorgonifer]|uniref:Related to Protein esc1 n=1 Tax=Cephalotrichum gorgonifer TaxID=2041049 RepID=A0AAE8SXS4_9PEZI|nr:related to Protein esc1 [Cephalotrichum gorgonifer]